MTVQERAFEHFAPALLQVYQRDKNAFWDAVMAPFLTNNNSSLARLRHFELDVGLLAAFTGLEDATARILKEFGAPLGFDVTAWKSNRPQYFKDAYPIFAFLVVWMNEEGFNDLVENFADILKAGVFAVAGYGILDANVDSDAPSSVEILTAQILIAEYEKLALQIFGVSKVNLDIMHEMRTLFLQAEIKEKSLRSKSSPYSLKNPKELGAKGANSVAPFMLSLERLGRVSLVPDYWEVFLLFGAAIQMIDDWEDLENDLAVGHYSYVTLGFEQLLTQKDSKKIAALLRANPTHVRRTFDISKDMLAQSRAILNRLNDSILVRLVDVTEARLETYFHQELEMS